MHKFGLLGKSLKHSFSKIIHEDISNIKYDLINLDETELEKFLKNKDFIGVNVTIPYKEKVIPFLDECDKICQETQVCNTIVNKNNKLFGYNTDYVGLCYLFDVNNVFVENKKVLILGNGATAKTTAYFLANRKAKQVTLLARNNKNNADLLENYQKYLDYEIIINATPVGMYPNVENSLLKLNEFQHLEAVFDVIYNPLKSKLLLEAEKYQIKNFNGLAMLVCQAIFANHYFTEQNYALEIISLEIKRLTYLLTNIVFIGMPGVGKSTIGKQLAKRLKRKYVDVDELIVLQEQKSINEIFNDFGEKYFREKEQEIIKQYSLQQGLVICCGGGVVLQEQNIENLKRNGKIILLNRDLDKIIIDNQRPLLKNKNDLKLLFEKRWDLYKKSCNIIVDNNASIEEAVNLVEEKFYESINS